MDKEKIKQATLMFLQAIGEDIDRPGLKDTPERVANMCEELFGGMTTDPDTHLCRVFEMEEPGVVIEKDISFYSMCEHHLLPFFGTVSIAYAYTDKVTGLSKLARTVEVYARRPQIQERMTRQIGEAVHNGIKGCTGVMVRIEAEHMCMSMRGIKKPGTKTVTLYTAGVFETDTRLKEETLRMLSVPC